MATREQLDLASFTGIRIFLMVVTGLLYPLYNRRSKLYIPHQSAGSLISTAKIKYWLRSNRQYFTSPKYFAVRPSAASGVIQQDSTSRQSQNPIMPRQCAASNYGVLNKNLINSVEMRAKAYRNENTLNANSRPAGMLLRHLHQD